MLPHPLPTHFPLHTQNYNRRGWFRRLFEILTGQVVSGATGKWGKLPIGSQTAVMQELWKDAVHHENNSIIGYCNY